MAEAGPSTGASTTVAELDTVNDAETGTRVGLTVIGWAAAFLLLGLPSVVCALKGRRGSAAFGAFIWASGWYVIQFTELGAGYGHWAVAFIGSLAALLVIAVSLDVARPGSWWFRRLFDEKQGREAEHRHREGLRPGSGEVRALRHYGEARFGRRGHDEGSRQT